MKAIVYTSNTGFTRKYAQMLSEILAVPAYNAGLGEDKKSLSKSDEIIYMGWVSAGKIEGFKKAAKRYNIKAVCPCGISEEAEAVTADLKNKNNINDNIPIFYLRGGVDFSKLTGMQKKMLMMIGNVLKKNSETQTDEIEIRKAKELIKILDKGANFTDKMKLKPVIKWYEEYIKKNK